MAEHSNPQDPGPRWERSAEVRHGSKGISFACHGDPKRGPATEHLLGSGQHAIDMPQRQRAKHPPHARKANRSVRPGPPVPPRGDHRGHWQAINHIEGVSVSKKQQPNGRGGIRLPLSNG